MLMALIVNFGGHSGGDGGEALVTADPVVRYSVNNSG